LRTFANSLKRKRIHLWMVFCSTEENARRNHDIIRSLTTGNFQHVQVQRMLVGDSQEARYWESKEALFARAAQYLDLRIMYLPIRTTNAIITAYGHKELLDSLKEKALVSRAATRASAQESLKSTALGAFLFRNE